MNTQQKEQQSFNTKTSCPLCHEVMTIKWRGDDIPYFGEVMHISSNCECGFRFADTMILTQKEPTRYEMTVDGLEDLNARVIRSTSGTIRIPELGIDVEPGVISDSYVTNIEGLLTRIESVVITATKWVEDDEEKYAQGLKIQNILEETMEGRHILDIVIEDPFGNSAIISEKAVCTQLTKDEADKLETGMIVYDVNSEEITVDPSDKAQTPGN